MRNSPMMKLSVVATLVFVSAALADVSAPVGLRCEYLTDPLGIDNATPRLSWKIKNDTRGATQTAYQIMVAGSAESLASGVADLWDSGKVASNQSTWVAYAGKALTSHRRCWWKVRYWDTDDKPLAWSEPACWSMGILSPDDWAGAKWITTTDQAPLPIFRKDFKAGKSVRRATAYICGLGQYELFLNGKKVGDRVMDPPWTNYRKRCTVATYDLTGQIKRGDNALGVMLGNGMYNVVGGRYVKFKGSMGKPMLICQIRLEYDDGTGEAIVSDSSWSATAGPITFSCIYGGEDYDARRDQPGWDCTGFDATSWKPAVETTGPGGRLIGPVAYPVEVMKAFDGLKGKQVAGDVVFDSGQNCSAMVKLTVRGPAGSSITVFPSEGSDGGSGRSDLSRGSNWNYTLRGGGSETWQSQFFYHGFRSVRVAGATLDSNSTSMPVIENLTIQHVRNSAPQAGEFQCSNELVNRIRHIILWSMHSNFQHVLTDCPHREKLGWLEVSHLMGPSFSYEYDAAGFFAKILDDMAEAQLDNGMVPDIAPEYVVFKEGFRDSPEWGSAYILNAMHAYRWYGDIGPLRTHYDGMKRYLGYLTSRAKDNILSHGLGDWMPQDKTPTPLVATATYYQDLIAMADGARLLGKDDDAKRFTALAEQVRGAFNKSFFNPETGQYGSGSETSNSMPLTLGMVEPEHGQAVLDKLVQEVVKRRCTFTAGDVGNRYVIQALARNGRSDLVYKMTVQADSPGYATQVQQGKTTLTESWNGGNSQNHCMLGHIEEWFFGDLLGIQPDPAATGFKKIIIAPQTVGDLDWVKGHYDSPYGRIAVEWRRKDATLTLDVTIPANTTATIFVPATRTAQVTAGGQQLADKAQGLKFLRSDDGRQVYEARSGHYRFVVSSR